MHAAGRCGSVERDCSGMGGLVADTGRPSLDCKPTVMTKIFLNV